MTRKRRFPARKTRSVFAPLPSFSIFAAFRSNARRADRSDCHHSEGSMRTIQKLNGSVRPAINAVGWERRCQSMMSLSLRRNPTGRRRLGKNASFRQCPLCVYCGRERRRISRESDLPGQFLNRPRRLQKAKKWPSGLSGTMLFFAIQSRQSASTE